VLGPSRILGLGGAYAGLAEGVDGVNANIAAPGVRAPFSGRHVEVDVTASVSLPGSFASTDFENRGTIPSRGDANASSFIYGNAGLLLQVGPFGSALTIDATSYKLQSPFGNATSVGLVRAHAILAWAFLKYQLVVGVGVQGATLSFSSASLFGNQLPLPAAPSGVAPEAGVLLKLDDQPWRLGVSAHLPVYGSVTGQSTNTFILPSSVVLPGQITIGFALQLGPRPLNPKWEDPKDDLEPLRARIDKDREERARRDAAELATIPEGPAHKTRQRELDGREHGIRRVEDARMDAEAKTVHDAHDARYLNWPRPRLLVVADAVITAPVDKAVAVSSFLDQTNQPYGGSWTVSPRLGLEGEPVIDRVKLRLGTYLEPSLFDNGSARQHFTFGGDLKLFSWNFFGILDRTTWQISFATDLAPRYSNWGISLGVWR
jgi:hypothetical protein